METALKSTEVVLARNSITHHKLAFFDEWTAENAYVLGFLEADAWVGWFPPAVRIKFVLSEKERAFMLHIKRLLGSDNKVSRFKHTLKPNNKVYYTEGFTVTSRAWFPILKTVLRIGLVPNIDIKLMPHYIRGYFDGNGSVFWNDSTKNYLRASFTSCRPKYLESLFETIQPITQSTMRLYHTATNRWEMKLSGKAVKNLGEYMYTSVDCADNFLPRKRQVFGL